MAVITEFYRREVEKWLASPKVESAVKDQIKTMSDDVLKAGFGKYMEIGRASCRERV